MAEDGSQTFKIEHVESSQFRSVFASGAIFSGPVDSSKNWILTFYTEGARILSETLVEGEGGYRSPEPAQIETERLRRDEVAVVISERQLVALVNAVRAAMLGDSK